MNKIIQLTKVTNTWSKWCLTKQKENSIHFSSNIIKVWQFPHSLSYQMQRTKIFLLSQSPQKTISTKINWLNWKWPRTHLSYKLEQLHQISVDGGDPTAYKSKACKDGHYKFVIKFLIGALRSVPIVSFYGSKKSSGFLNNVWGHSF